MTSQIVRDLSTTTLSAMPARQAMDIIEQSTAPSMEKNLARSVLMESNSRLQGEINVRRLTTRIEDKVDFWRDIRENTSRVHHQTRF